MLEFKRVALAIALLGAASIGNAAVTQIGSIASPGAVSQLAYSSETGTLVLRNSGSAIRVLNLGTQKVTSLQMANSLFTDIDLSPSGKVLYAADYGYENIGYGTPVNQHYVHRLDLQTGQWSTQTTNRIAGNLETVDDQRFILQSRDQWVETSVNQWGTGTAVNPVGNELSWGVYNGEMQYDATHGRLLHGNRGLSSPEVDAFKLTGNTLTEQEGSGTYGAAYRSGSGGSVVLASDDSVLYYGALQFDSLDMGYVQRVFPERIIAANGAYAFSGTKYYDALTGQLVGSLGGTFSSFAFSRSTSDFWGFDTSTNKLVHFASSVPEPSAWTSMVIGLIALGAMARRKKA